MRNALSRSPLLERKSRVSLFYCCTSNFLDEIFPFEFSTESDEVIQGIETLSSFSRERAVCRETLKTHKIYVRVCLMLSASLGPVWLYVACMHEFDIISFSFSALSL